ncbi:MAG: NADP-dependent oxidoreductase [Alphaproteobacteria bacterium]
MSTATNRPVNRKITLLKYADGPVTPDMFQLEEEPAREPGEGEVLVETDSISIDAFIRTSLNDWEGFHMQVPIGGVIGALAVGRVIESNAKGWEPGDAVSGPLGSQTFATVPTGMLQKVDDSLPLSTYLGALGLTTGLTAFCGMRYVGQVKEGETVLVSGAAGAVGSIAGQIAKLDGARVIGIAGGPEKVKFLTETLGLDAGIDYKNEDVAERVKELAPKGIDVFFDNVGGEILDVALDNIRERGRIAICGAISQYDDHLNVRGPSLYLRLAERYARMEGFTVMHFADKFPEAFAQLGQWVAEGKLKMPEHVVEGIDSFPDALITMFNGGHMGKMLVKP